MPPVAGSYEPSHQIIEALTLGGTRGSVNDGRAEMTGWIRGGARLCFVGNNGDAAFGEAATIGPFGLHERDLLRE